MKQLRSFLIDLHKLCQFSSKEQQAKKATNSEIHRWIQQGNVQINGEICRDPKEPMDFPIVSFVLFPKSDKRVTLY